MNRIAVILILWPLFFTSVFGSETTSTPKKPSWFKRAGHRLTQIWTEGTTELYLSGYAWHNRYTYSAAKIKKYNELAWGGGLGKGFYDEDGDWHALSAIAFLDSHKNLEPAAGYTFLKIARIGENIRLGGGYSILITARPDLYHNRPFPGILPWASITYKQATLSTTYIPGSKGAGNVLYILGKWTFNKL